MLCAPCAFWDMHATYSRGITFHSEKDEGVCLTARHREACQLDPKELEHKNKKKGGKGPDQSHYRTMLDPLGGDVNIAELTAKESRGLK